MTEEQFYAKSISLADPLLQQKVVAIMSDQTIEQRLEAELKPILGTHVKQSILYHNLLQLLNETRIDELATLLNEANLDESAYRDVADRIAQLTPKENK